MRTDLKQECQEQISSLGKFLAFVRLLMSLVFQRRRTPGRSVAKVVGANYPWSKGGLFPFNLEKPFATLTEAAEPSSEVVSPPIAAPVTPVTPVCATGFAALRDAIINGDACALDEVDKQKLDRHIGKLAKAAQVS
jgi:hypothetical protein